MERVFGGQENLGATREFGKCSGIERRFSPRKPRYAE